MALWDKLKQELDHAGKVAQSALDEGRVRLEAFRSRQQADKDAQALGYAVYRAKHAGQELEADTWQRLATQLEKHESEALKHEATLATLVEKRKTAGQGKPPTPPVAPDQPQASPPPPPPPPPAAA